MSKPREPAHVHMARAVALLMAAPRTHTDLRLGVGVHKDVPASWTTALHSAGLVYVADWVSHDNCGPKMALWTWQTTPFALPDCARPTSPRKTSRVVDLAAYNARQAVIAERKARIAAEAAAKKAARDQARADRAARAAARAHEKEAAESDVLVHLTPSPKPPVHLRSIFDMAGAT